MPVFPRLSDEAWALLGLLHRKGTRVVEGFESAYAELRANALMNGDTISERGEQVLRARYLRGLSGESWTLLGILHRAAHSGTIAPPGSEKAYKELELHQFARKVSRCGWTITEEGEAALRDRYLGE
jgi:hypothetical protein